MNTTKTFKINNFHKYFQVDVFQRAASLREIQILRKPDRTQERFGC